MKQKQKEIVELKEELASLRKRFFQVDKMLDCQGQYSRRNCVLSYGVDEKNNDNTDQEIINIIKK